MTPKALLVDILFYPSEPGRRSAAPNLSCGRYCPHLIVKGTKDYLGIRFVDGDVTPLKLDYRLPRNNV